MSQRKDIKKVLARRRMLDQIFKHNFRVVRFMMFVDGLDRRLREYVNWILRTMSYANFDSGNFGTPL